MFSGVELSSILLGMYRLGDNKFMRGEKPCAADSEGGFMFLGWKWEPDHVKHRI